MTVNPRIHRFDFGGLRDFRGPIIVNKTIAEELTVAPPPAPSAPLFNEYDLESARLAGRKMGYTEGFTAGRIEAKKEADIKIEEANIGIAKLGDMVSGLQAAYVQMIAHESVHLSTLVTSVARKVAGEAIDARGVETIAAVVTRCLPVIFAKPKVIIELGPEVLEQAMGRIETQLRAQGFEGEIQFRTNHDLASSDVKVDWGTGEVNRSVTALWDEIETLIERIPLEIIFADTLNTIGE